MPGLIVELRVKPGEAVKAGQTVLIMEAMKMENDIQSPRDGVVAEVLVAQGEEVTEHQNLVLLAP